LCWC